MKLAKRIIKWGMLGVPVLLIIYGFLVVSFSQADALASGKAISQLIFYWVIISLITLGVIKLIERVRAKI